MAGLAEGGGGIQMVLRTQKRWGGKGNWTRCEVPEKKSLSLCIARISEDWVSEHVEGNPRDISFHSAEGLASPKLGVSVSCVMEGPES